MLDNIQVLIAAPFINLQLLFDGVMVGVRSVGVRSVGVIKMLYVRLYLYIHIC